MLAFQNVFVEKGAKNSEAVRGVCGVCVGCVGRGWKCGTCVGRWGRCVGRKERVSLAPLYYPDTLVNPDTCLGSSSVQSHYYKVDF